MCCAEHSIRDLARAGLPAAVASITRVMAGDRKVPKSVLLLLCSVTRSIGWQQDVMQEPEIASVVQQCVRQLTWVF